MLARNPVHSALFLAADAGQRRGAVPAAGRRARRRDPDRRLRERDRRAVPVRDHAARRRPARVVRRAAAAFQRPAAIVLGVLLLVAGARARRPPLGHRRALDRAARSATPARRQRRDARDEPLHRLRLAVRDHRGAARDRGRRQRRARPPQRPAAGEPSADGRPAGERARDRASHDDHARPTTSRSRRCSSRSARSGCSSAATRS